LGYGLYLGALRIAAEPFEIGLRLFQFREVQRPAVGFVKFKKFFVFGFGEIVYYIVHN